MTDTSDKDLIKLIRHLRVSRKISQQELSTLTSIPRVRIATLETKRGARLTGDELVAYCQVFGPEHFPLVRSRVHLHMGGGIACKGAVIGRDSVTFSAERTTCPDCLAATKKLHAQ